jgi:hypothetical protein
MGSGARRIARAQALLVVAQARSAVEGSVANTQASTSSGSAGGG